MTKETYPAVRQTVLDCMRPRELALGARLLLDRSEDEEELLRVHADLAGHPFCIFVAAPPGV